MSKIKELIHLLRLEPLLPEGGYYRKTYETGVEMNFQGGTRRTMSAIYYLVTHESFSALHQLKSDEIYHFYDGDPLELHLISPEGVHTVQVLGTDLKSNQLPQFVVPAGHWQCSKQYRNHHGYSLLGTTVSPGFEFADFKMAVESDLRMLPLDLQSLIKPFISHFNSR